MKLHHLFASVPLSLRFFPLAKSFSFVDNHVSVQRIASTPVSSPVTVNYESTLSTPIDSPHISALNGTTYQWWYFEAIPTNPVDNTTVTVIFYATTLAAFPFLLPADTDTLVGIYITLPNGTTWSAQVDATSAVISWDDQDGVQGTWEGSGSSFEGFGGSGTPKNYNVEICDETVGVKGKLIMTGVANSHYACGAEGPGVNMELGPNVGWSNVLPDADAVVEFEVPGAKFNFHGIGYHDQNWGDAPFGTTISSWYWGHGRLGDLSLVWYSFLSLGNKISVGAYASKNGNILTSSCSPGALTVLPYGANSEYPPTPLTGSPSGFNIVMDLGSEGVLTANVSTDLLVLGGLPTKDTYFKWLGKLEGSVGGGDSMTGVAMFDQFALIGSGL